MITTEGYVYLVWRMEGSGEEIRHAKKLIWYYLHNSSNLISKEGKNMTLFDTFRSRYHDIVYKLGESRYERSKIALKDYFSEVTDRSSKRSFTETPITGWDNSIFFGKTFDSSGEGWVTDGLQLSEAIQGNQDLLKSEAEKARQKRRGVLLDRREFKDNDGEMVTVTTGVRGAYQSRGQIYVTTFHKQYSEDDLQKIVTAWENERKTSGNGKSGLSGILAGKDHLLIDVDLFDNKKTTFNGRTVDDRQDVGDIWLNSEGKLVIKQYTESEGAIPGVDLGMVPKVITAVARVFADQPEVLK